MDLSDYFNQNEVYFSESQGKLISIDSMPIPYALNSFKKLITEFGDDFMETRLYRRLWKQVTPEMFELRSLLQRHGKAAIYIGPYSKVKLNAARSRLYRAGARRTWKKDELLYGDFGEIQIQVRKKALSGG